MFLIKLVIKWLILSGAVFITAWFIPGIHVSSWIVALIAGLILGLINMFIKPVLTILTFPINLITLGLFSIVLNALLFWGTAHLVNGFDIDNFLAALLGSLVVAVVIWLYHLLLD